MAGRLLESGMRAGHEVHCTSKKNLDIIVKTGRGNGSPLRQWSEVISTALEGSLTAVWGLAEEHWSGGERPVEMLHFLTGPPAV